MDEVVAKYRDCLEERRRILRQEEELKAATAVVRKEQSEKKATTPKSLYAGKKEKTGTDENAVEKAKNMQVYTKQQFAKNCRSGNERIKDIICWKQLILKCII